MTSAELKKIIELHRKWMFSEEGGARAYLDGANLAGANLAGAYLARAYLARAYLDGANLAGANLAGAYLDGANLAGANLARANLAGANLDGANLAGAYLARANLAGANLASAYLAGAYLDGANGKKTKVKKLAAFSGLYRYQVWAVIFADGKRWIRMGCLFKSVEEWNEITIEKSNLKEFPEDGSVTSRQRVLAFEFAKRSLDLMAK